MRLEVTIPDSTRPELKARIADIARRLSDEPELANEIDLEHLGEPTPAWMLAELDLGLADLDEGRAVGFEEYRSNMQENRDRWMSQHRLS